MRTEIGRKDVHSNLSEPSFGMAEIMPSSSYSMWRSRPFSAQFGGGGRRRGINCFLNFLNHCQLEIHCRPELQNIGLCKMLQKLSNFLYVKVRIFNFIDIIFALGTAFKASHNNEG